MNGVPIRLIIASGEGGLTFEGVLPVTIPIPAPRSIVEFTTSELIDELHRRLTTAPEPEQ